MDKQFHRTPWRAVVSIVAALLYDVSPIDLIPDVIPLLGWADDFLVSVLLTLFTVFSWRKWKKSKARAELPVIVS